MTLLVLPVLVITLLSLGSCARIALPPAPTLNIQQLDTRALHGKVIVLDPGHGGPEAGAVGRQGLKESEVNLGVALYLWGLLSDAGARPILTRATDAAVLAKTAFDLKQDLQARTDTSNRAGADLFVSIHHNAAVEGGPQNDLMIFYKMSDTLRSRDIAREICSALQSRLAPRAVHVQPGNYHVLRNASAPAVLGEASFMSNTKNETRLSFHRTLRLEAEGYFMGILNYYGKGVPIMAELQPSGVVAQPQPELRARCDPGSDNGSIDPSSVGLVMDNKQVKDYAFQGQGLITYRPSAPLSNARHRFCLSARNLRGNSSAKACAEFTVSLPPHRIKVSPVFPTIPADGIAASPLDITVLDALERPVIDNTTIQVSATGGSLLQTNATTEAGRARVLLISGHKPQRAIVTARAGNVSSSCAVTFGVVQEALLKVSICDPEGRPVKDARLTREGSEVILSDASGSAYDSLKGGGPVAYRVTKKGFRPLELTHNPVPGSLAVQNLRLEPFDNGVFFGRRIILDPAAGDNTTRAVISRLGQMIEEAGGAVLQTWEQPPAPPAASRVSLSVKERADLFLTVDTVKRKPEVGYYFKSSQGQRLAGMICRHLMETGCPRAKKCRSVTSTQYVIIHTSMPAVWITVPTTAQPGDVAKAVYAALRDFFEGQTTAAPDSKADDKWMLEGGC
jgi:N-acetylmuramoyl-L-alanine amidase